MGMCLNYFTAIVHSCTGLKYNQCRNILEGFLVGDDEVVKDKQSQDSGSDEDDDDDDGPRKKKRRRHLSEEELTDEDYDLLEENLGVKMKRVKNYGLKLYLACLNHIF